MNIPKCVLVNLDERPQWFLDGIATKVKELNEHRANPLTTMNEYIIDAIERDIKGVK